jgi:hypothetical protein
MNPKGINNESIVKRPCYFCGKPTPRKEWMNTTNLSVTFHCYRAVCIPCSIKSFLKIIYFKKPAIHFRWLANH